MDIDDPEITELPRQKSYESETEINAGLMQPEGKTSFRAIMVWDPVRKAYVKKAQNSGSPEINLSDLTSAILVGKKSEFAFAWHTVNIINQWDFIQTQTGYDCSSIIRFHYNNLITNLSLSKSVDGALMKALTTKELKQIHETREVSSGDKSPQSLRSWITGARKKASTMYKE
jgi:hypothetical protein